MSRHRPFRSLSDQPLTARYRFFRAHAGYIVGQSAVCAMLLARAEQRAEEYGLEVVYQDDLEAWDGDGEAPPIHVWACVRHPDTGYVLATLGGIGFMSWRDPYVRLIEAELFQEAIENMQKTESEQVLAEVTRFGDRGRR